MILRTVEQVRRIFLILAGFTLLALGIVMIFTPGPGTPVILMGLGLLAAGILCARRDEEPTARERARRDGAAHRPPMGHEVRAERYPACLSCHRLERYHAKSASVAT